MAEHLLPDFRINKDEPENGIKALLEIIKPHWNHENVQQEAISGGYSSKIFKCFDPKDPDDAVTIRIRFMIDSIKGFENFKNEVEPLAIQHLSKTEHFPTVHAIFANGYCYQYIKGAPIFNIRLKTGTMDEKQMNAIAKELVYIHSVKLENVDYKTDEYMTRIDLITGIGPIILEHNLAPTKEALVKETHVIRDYIKSLNLPLVLCHGDVHPGNFVWNKENDKITFVDWEGTCIGYRHVEVAYFIEIIGLFCLTSSSQEQMSAPDDFENKFLKTYFKEWCIVDQQEFIEEEYQNFKSLVHKCKLFQNLMTTTVRLILPRVAADLVGDQIKFVGYMLEKYSKLKEEILGTSKFDADLP